MPLGGLTVSLIVVDALLRRLILPLVLLLGENNIIVHNSKTKERVP